ncbi:class I SAM-dependent methyltransferase [Sphingobium yanoikuyae]|uniref:class I SAM-dependent methyltransferase n=1 Tax=Sphingobium yanoikuyae TaxID=13690 RepID=UPI0009B5DC55|nr:class I SAM-dependent methyltransferase [Sphingobium yanoikuyae]
MEMKSKTPTRSNSSLGSIPLVEKLKYAWQLLKFRIGEPGAKDFAMQIRDEVAGVAAIYERETGKLASQARVLEIGFGPRPQRAFGLTGFFKDVIAVDLDAPVMGIRDLVRVFRKNGLERGIKSLVRYALFDAREWPMFHKVLVANTPHYRPNTAKLIVGSAGDHSTWEQFGGAIDIVFSTDVFEHIPPAELEVLLTTIRSRLAPGGIVVTRPVVYTGIAGGHAVEWYPQNVAAQTDGTTAWRHLLDPDFTINTYLNKLTRRDFVELFNRVGFEIGGDFAEFGRMGERWMTAEKRAALAHYDDYELYSNRVEFLLR